MILIRIEDHKSFIDMSTEDFPDEEPPKAQWISISYRDVFRDNMLQEMILECEGPKEERESATIAAIAKMLRDAWKMMDELNGKIESLKRAQEKLPPKLREEKADD